VFITYSDDATYTLSSGPGVTFMAKPISENWQEIEVQGYTEFKWQSGAEAFVA